MIFGTKRVYADAAASMPLSSAALRELERLVPLFGNPSALHKEGMEAKKELERARATVAESIGAHADEIIFTSGGTEANNLAVGGLEFLHAITSAVEHPSVLEPLRKSSAQVVELKVDPKGLIDPKELAEKITNDTTFVSIQLVNSEVGTVEPIQEIAKVLRKASHKIFFHTDASQAPLWLKLTVEQLHVDLMTLDAQKIGGPKGSGALYVRRGTPLHPVTLGGGQEKNLRSGTENVPLAGAFAVALKEAQEQVETRAEKTAEVRDYLWSEIKKVIPDALLNGPMFEHRVANNLNISIPGLEAQMAVVSLDALGVAASTRSACSIGSDEPSHVIKALGISKELAGTAIRFSLLPDATKNEMDRIVNALLETTQRYRQTRQ